MKLRRLFFAAILFLMPLSLAAQEWAAYGTISAEPTSGRICTGDTNGKDILCASPAPYVDGSGNVGIGTASPDRAITISGTTANDSGLLQVRSIDTPTGPIHYLRKRRVLANGQTQNSDNLGSIIGVATDETGAARESAMLQFYASGLTTSTLGYGGGITFWTAPSTSAQAFVERMRIDSAGNVGIGNTDPATLLDVGTTTFSNTLADNAKLFLRGTYTTGSTDATYGSLQVGLNGNANYGAIFGARRDASSGTHAQIGVRHGGTSLYAIDINSSGYVGIGTASPASPLEVVGNIFSTSGGGIYASNPGAAPSGSSVSIAAPAGVPGATFMIGDGAGAASKRWDVRVETTSGFNIFESSGTGPSGVYRLSVNPGGNVGIGTTSPATTALLDVFSTTKGFLPPRMTTTQRDAISTPAAGLTVYNSTTSALNVYSGSSWTALGSVSPAGSSGQIQFNNSGAFGADAGLHWDNTNKRLGIGTASPAVTLDVNGAVFGTYLRSTGAAEIDSFLGFNLRWDTGAWRYRANGVGSIIQKQANRMSWWMGNTVNAAGADAVATLVEAIAILTSGNVGIGTASPAEKLEVSGNIKASGTLQVANSTATCTGAADYGKFRYNPVNGKLQICKP